MMFTNITPAVEQAMKDAQTWASRLGSAEIQSEHLLAALLDQEGGSVETLLIQAGLDITKKGEILGSALIQGTESRHSVNQRCDVPPSPNIEKVWHRARELAGESADDRTVGSEHLLLALLESEPAVRERLEKLGLVPDRLEMQFQARKPLPLDEPLALAEPTEEIQLARILDASANRAREALRVLEDYGRFALGDTFLSGQLKRIRHELADALGCLPIHHLLESRETERDVGRNLTAQGEESRHSLDAVPRIPSAPRRIARRLHLP